MIRMLVGDNFFLRRERLQELIGENNAERFEGERLEHGQLIDLVLGQSLFDDARIVIIDELSSNKDLWDILPEQDTQNKDIILLEPKPDKRTKTYKWLVKNATVEQLDSFSERQIAQVVAWLIGRAKEAHSIRLERSVAESIVGRLGRDQLRLDNFLEQLELADRTDQSLIDAMLPLAQTASVFNLFSAALDGKRQEVHETIRYLEFSLGSDGAYQTLGLITSQAMNLTALVLANGDTGRVAEQLGVSSYALGSLTRHAQAMNKQRLASLNHALFRADQQMKSTSVNPWLLLEAALMVDV